MKVRIAAVQMEVEDSIADNLKEILEGISDAKKDSCDFVCFPELSLVCDEKLVKNITEETNKIKQAAKENNINVIFGTYVKEDDKIRNQIWTINKRGEIIYKYNKRHSYMTEKMYVTEGRRNKVLDSEGVKFAVINCWDYAYPEDIRKLAKEGANEFYCGIVSKEWEKRFSFIASANLRHDKIANFSSFEELAKAAAIAVFFRSAPGNARRTKSGSA